MTNRSIRFSNELRNDVKVMNRFEEICDIPIFFIDVNIL